VFDCKTAMYCIVCYCIVSCRSVVHDIVEYCMVLHCMEKTSCLGSPPLICVKKRLLVSEGVVPEHKLGSVPDIGSSFTTEHKLWNM
jgi:hypothetical protein